MPGRGRPWKGVGEGNPDRIGTGAIADGSITEADLDSSVTSKLNSASGHEVLDEGGSLPQRGRIDFVGEGVVASDGIEDTTTVTIPGGAVGGVWEQIGTFTVSSPQTTMPVTFSTSQPAGSYAQILVVAEFVMSTSNAVDLELTGPSGYGPSGSTVSISTTGVVTGSNWSQTDLIGTTQDFGENFNIMKVSIQSTSSGSYSGYIDEVTSDTSRSRQGGYISDTFSSTTMTGIVIKSKTNNFNVGGKVSVYVQAF